MSRCSTHLKLSTCTSAHGNQDVFPTQSFRYAHVCAQSGLATPARWSSFSFSCSTGKSHSVSDCPPLLCQDPAIALHSLPKKCHSQRSAAVWGGKATQHVMSCRGLVLLLPLKWDISFKFFVVVVVLFHRGFFGKNWNVFLQWNL